MDNVESNIDKNVSCLPINVGTTSLYRVIPMLCCTLNLVNLICKYKNYHVSTEHKIRC